MTDKYGTPVQGLLCSQVRNHVQPDRVPKHIFNLQIEPPVSVTPVYRAAIMRDTWFDMVRANNTEVST